MVVVVRNKERARRLGWIIAENVGQEQGMFRPEMPIIGVILGPSWRSVRCYEFALSEEQRAVNTRPEFVAKSTSSNPESK